MSEPAELLIYWSGIVVISVVFGVYAWLVADRDAAKQVEKLDPPPGVALSDDSQRWLRAHFVRRTRWSIVTTTAALNTIAPIMFVFRDVPMIDELGSHNFIAALLVGYTVGETLATVISAHASLGPRRSATLTPRTRRTYLRWWEYALTIGHVLCATIAVVVALLLRLSGSISGEQSAFYGGLAVAWLLLLGGIWQLQSWVLRATPVVEKNLHLARELLVSVAVRSLAHAQLLLLAVVCTVAATFAWQTFDLPWIVTASPIYIIAGIMLVAFCARLDRTDRGAPAPEWYFARTLEPTP